jgi:formamidopyrimidine-DNA glycosylase
MPEGPQVLKTTNKLKRYLEGNILFDITINSGRYEGKPVFQSLVLPTKVKNIGCKGKFMWWEFENSDQVMFNTLGMSGLWWSGNDKHNHVTFSYYNKQGKSKKIHFNDVRNFGTFKISNKHDLEKKLKELGPDVLGDYNFDEFIKRINRKRNNPAIGLVLMDQKVISGIGNYLRADILWYARQSPFRQLKSFTDNELLDLYNMARHITLRSYNYKMKRGDIPDITRRHFLVYNQHKDPEGFPVLREKLGDRTVHFAPIRQSI